MKWVWVVLMLGIVAAPAAADDAAELAKLREEIRALREQNESTEKELAKLREENAQLKKGRAGNRKGGVVGADDEPAPDPLLPTIKGARELLNMLPADARAAGKKGWDTFAVAKANRWLKENATNRMFEHRCRIERVRIREDAQNKDKWKVLLEVQDEETAFSGSPMRISLQVEALSVDDASAKKAQSLRSGQWVSLKGTLAASAVESSGPRANLGIYLKNVVMELSQ